MGTRTVEASEYLSKQLKVQGIRHKLLNARQDKEEADIVAEAGLAGAVTIATNMAGRGTDIKLGPGVAALGGLFVLATERHDSPRIDRQLFGRCGRQGDPGTTLAVLSFDDDIVRLNSPSWLSSLAEKSHSETAPRWLFQISQKIAEKRQYNARCNVQRQDQQYAKLLAFSGQME